MTSHARIFRVIAATLASHLGETAAIAAARAGHAGLLDLDYVDPTSDSVRGAVSRLAGRAGGCWGLKLGPGQVAPVCASLAEELSGASLFVLAGDGALDRAHVERLRAAAPGAEILAELRDAAGLPAAEAAGVDGLVAKGHEAGGAVGEETGFVLVQRLLAETTLPVIAQGGVGPHSAAAYRVAGAAGVLLDWQLALFPEACTPEPLARAVARMDGSETRVLGGDLGHPHRVFWRADHAPAQELHRLEAAGAGADAFLEALRAAVTPEAAEGGLWLMGQDAGLARRLRDRHRRLGAALDAIARASAGLTGTAQRLTPLAEGAPLAAANGTRYPILQGPMTRVSDVPDFALAVAEGGALPFLALALMRRAQADRLLAQTAEKLGERPWGVGILGFVDDALREEQTAAIAAHRPRFALIAGGRPDQATALEAQGIATYLHVPSPGLLSLFLESGAKRFVFEGRECGGHVGPRSSAVLWQQAIDALLDHFGQEGGIDCDLIFAGGVHDAVSGAMVSVMAAELAERGARIGVIVGTAYLLTQEAVQTGAILENYQAQVLHADRTVLLDSAPGHATRVAMSPVVGEFLRERRQLQAEGVAPDAVRERLEAFSIGRSRIAAKGVDRNPDFGTRPEAGRFVTLDRAEQTARGLFMIGQVAGLHDAPTTIARLHEEICAGASAVLEAALPQAETRAASGDAVPEGPGARIAITGIGTLLPGASDFPTYWENILDKRDAIQEVPERRWDWRRYYDEDRDAPDKAYSKWGGFVDEIAFDPIRYGIPPNSVPSIEPLQLLVLETVRRALEDAGFPDGVIEDAALRRRTSVILGVGGGTGPLGQCYAVRSSLPAVEGGLSATAAARLPEWTEDSFPGILLNVIAGRVANRFDLGGVNFTVDAACGSSLAAVLAAVREIEAGSSDMVIVAGADSFQNPFDFVAFSKTRALSPRGRCRTFDAGADGIAISEGVAVMVLRRLEEAEAASDRIYAVLRGVAGSSDGRDLSLTAPRLEGQKAALRRAYARAGVSPATVGLIEAHGTGTVVGDRTEIQSLAEAFAEGDAGRQVCGVGSVKSMIGHTKAAAGAAGMVKAAMALHSKVLPATLHVETPNSGVDFAQSPFYLTTDTRPWLCPQGRPRRAGVSAFGFGGTNFHAVLEEYRGGYLLRHQAPLRRNWTHELYLFSADDREALAAKLARAAEALAAAPPGLRPADVTASLARVFAPGAGARLALVAASLGEAAERLAGAAERVVRAGPETAQTDPLGAWFSAERPLRPDQVAFLFPGQGSQYPNMAADLVMLFPEMRETIEAAASLLEGLTPGPLGELIFPRPALDDAEAARQAEALKRTDAAQPAIGAVSLAMLGLLGRAGLRPGVLAGHSFGEYTALHAAGAFDAETLLTLAHARGDAMVRAGGDDPGQMAAVGAKAEDILAVLGAAPGVTIANRNAPDQTVIAGPGAAVEAASGALEAAGFSVAPLPVACGFHSECVAPAGARLARALEAARIGAPGLPVFANATAAPYPAEADAVRAQLVGHLVDPVDFMGAIEAMHAGGARLFLEVGPGAVLSGLTGRILQGRPHLALPLDRKGRPGAQQLLGALAGAAVAGLDLTLDFLWQQRVDGPVDVTGWRFEPEQEAGTIWMVDAARARPKGQPPLRKGLSARIEEDPAQIGMKGGIAMPSEPSATGQPAPAPAGADEAMRRHQELMACFLENNRAVMMAYLQAGGDAAALPAMSAPPVSGPMAEEAAAPEVVPIPGAPAAPPPETEAETDRSEARVRRLLLDLIADRTGYPPEMLEGDLDLEADLGIDSIKRVEILAALRGAILPWTSEEARSRMGPVSREKTVAGIVAKFMEIVAEFAPAPGRDAPAPENAAPEAPAEEPLPELADWPARFEIVPREIYVPLAGDWVMPGAAYVLTCDAGGTAGALARAIEAKGGVPCLLEESDFADTTGLRRTLAAVRDRVAGVLHCAPLSEAPGIAAHVQDWDAGVDRASRNLFLLLSVLGPALSAREDAIVLCATAMGGSFGFGEAPRTPAAGGAPGLLKTLAKEWPGVLCRAVDVAPETGVAERAETLFAEAGRADGMVEIGWQGGARLGLFAEARPATGPVPDDLGLAPDAVVLVTGGARGITARILRRLARSQRCRFVLLGASPEPGTEAGATLGLTEPRALKSALIAAARAGGRDAAPAAIEAEYRALLKAREIRATLQALAAEGAEAEYHCCDVCDAEGFAAAIEGVYARHGRIDGVLHGAGVIEDRLILDKTPESFARVLRTKTRSAHVLARALDPESLRFCVFFTSVAGRFGNRGQGDYAAANETLAKLAAYLDAGWPGRVMAIDWGPWDSGGMVTEEVKAKFAGMRIEPVPPALGVEALAWEIAQPDGPAEIVWGRGPWESDRQSYEAHYARANAPEAAQ